MLSFCQLPLLSFESTSHILTETVGTVIEFLGKIDKQKIVTYCSKLIGHGILRDCSPISNSYKSIKIEALMIFWELRRKICFLNPRIKVTPCFTV